MLFIVSAAHFNKQCAGAKLWQSISRWRPSGIVLCRTVDFWDQFPRDCLVKVRLFQGSYSHGIWKCIFQPGKVMEFGENGQGHGKVMKFKFSVLIYTFLLHQNLEHPSFNWAKVCWENGRGTPTSHVFLFVIMQYAVHTWSYFYSTSLPRYSTLLL